MAIIVTELSTGDQYWLENVLQTAQDQGQTVKISQHSGTGQIMVKRGGGAWSPLIGTDVSEREDEGIESERRARRARGQEGWV